MPIQSVLQRDTWKELKDLVQIKEVAFLKLFLREFDYLKLFWLHFWISSVTSEFKFFPLKMRLLTVFATLKVLSVFRSHLWHYFFVNFRVLLNERWSPLFQVLSADWKLLDAWKGFCKVVFTLNFKCSKWEKTWFPISYKWSKN